MRILIYILLILSSSVSYAENKIVYNLGNFSPGEEIVLHAPGSIKLGGIIEVLPDASISIYKPVIIGDEEREISARGDSASWFCSQLGLKYKDNFIEQHDNRFKNIFKFKDGRTHFKRSYGKILNVIYCEIESSEEFGSEDFSSKSSEDLLQKLKNFLFSLG